MSSIFVCWNAAQYVASLVLASALCLEIDIGVGCPDLFNLCSLSMSTTLEALISWSSATKTIHTLCQWCGGNCWYNGDEDSMDVMYDMKYPSSNAISIPMGVGELVG